MADTKDVSEAFLEKWHRIVAAGDAAGIASVLASDVTMGAPPYWAKLSGVDVVQHLLGIIVNTIEGFTYHREFTHGAELALEFHGRVGDLDLQGIDLISLDADGRLRNIDVMARSAPAPGAFGPDIFAKAGKSRRRSAPSRRARPIGRR